MQNDTSVLGLPRQRTPPTAGNMERFQAQLAGAVTTDNREQMATSLPHGLDPAVVQAWQVATRDAAADPGSSVACQTIKPSDRSTVREYNPGHLPLYAVQEAPDLSMPQGPAVLVLGVKIGEGGMGLVRLGQQVSMRRDVAVKTLRAGASDPLAASRLLQEALITGALEHPNIVPVYDLARDDSNLPLIVMKRLEGRTWDTAIANRPADATAAWFDWLQEQLHILMQVCNAVGYAHSRGIVHRDLKPTNIMIGDFGEVYVLDWGVAVALREDARGRFPVPAVGQVIAGTPAYMAPEQVMADGLAVSPRTDIYLMGAILHEILTGRAPHDQQPVLAALFSAFQSEPPQLGAHLPEELITICRRAMARDPQGRYATAEDLRLALNGFLSHRGSTHLVVTARERLRALEKQVDGGGTGLDGNSLGDSQQVSKLFDESRFGFLQALAIWPENAAASAGLQACLETMIRHELARGEVRRAAVLLGELPRENPTLSQQLAQRKAQLKEQSAELERLRSVGEQYDLGVGFRTRRRLALLIGIIWTIVPLAIAQATAQGADVARPSLAVSSVLFLTFVVLATVLGRRTLMATAVNRTVTWVMGALSVSLALGRMLSWLDGATLAQMMARDHLSMFVATSALALLVDVRLMWAALAYLLGGIAIALFPAAAFYITALANFVAMFGMVWFWRPSNDRRPDLPARRGQPAETP